MTFKQDPKYKYYINLVNGFQINILRIIKLKLYPVSYILLKNV